MMRIALLVCLATPAWAGPWTKDAGQVYVKLSQSAFVSDSFRDAEGRLQTGVDYQGWTTAVYAELGLVDGLHLQVYLPYIAAKNTYDTGNSYLSAGGGDVELGLQGRLPLPLPAALKVALKAPMYDVGAIGGTQATFFPQRGDGQIDVTLWASLGGSLPGLPVYLFGEAGHRIRTERYTGTGNGLAFEDTLVWAGQLGWTIGGVVVAANINGARPYADDDVTKGYINVGPSVFWPVGGGVALEATHDHVLSARNTAEGLSFGLGVSWSHQE